MSNPTDPYDALASMFLTEERTGSVPKETTPPSLAPVEAVIVGHLPVRASLWLTPYTATRAREAGPTAMIRLDGDEPMVQLHRGLDDQPPASACRSLRETILQIGSDAQLWLLRPSLQTHPEELLATRPDRISILSSADQVAVVHAYRVVKELWEAAQHLDAPLPPVGLAILGADAAAAAEVQSRVSRTTQEQLGLEIELHLCLPAMDATVRASCLRSFPGLGRPALRDVRAWIREAAMHGAGEPTRTPEAQATPMEPPTAQEHHREAPVGPAPSEAEPPSVEVAPAQPTSFSAGRSEQPEPPTAAGRSVSPAESEPEMEPVEAIDPPTPLADFIAGSTPTADAPTGPSGSATAVEEAAEVRLSPKPSERETEQAAPTSTNPAAESGARATEDFEAKPANDHPAEPCRNGEPVPLSEYVPGLRPLPVRCPEHEHVELAADEDGHLHLLAKPHDMRHLVAVESWATAHRDILAMACPNVSLAARPKVSYHVFTSDPLSVSDLQRSKVSLHLLAPVTVEGKQGWYATALNTPAKR